VFEVHPEFTYISSNRDQIVAVIESINSPMVAAANKPLEPAKSYIVGVRNPSGLFSIYVYLHLLQSKECLIYLHDPTEIPMEDYHDTEVEALQFVESMGFMVDNLNFRKMAPDQQQTLMDEMPVFSDDLEGFAKRKEAQSMPSVEEVEDLEDSDDVIELDDVAEVEAAPPAPQKVVTQEGLARIIKLFSSF
jgi:hypothetical protein